MQHIFFMIIDLSLIYTAPGYFFLILYCFYYYSIIARIMMIPTYATVYYARLYIQSLLLQLLIYIALLMFPPYSCSSSMSMAYIARGYYSQQLIHNARIAFFHRPCMHITLVINKQNYISTYLSDTLHK